MSDENKVGTPTNPAPLADHPEFHGAEPAPLPEGTKSTKVEIVVAPSPVGTFSADSIAHAKGQLNPAALTFDQPIAHPNVEEALRLFKLSGDKQTVTVRSVKTGAQKDFPVSEVFDPRAAENHVEALKAAAPVPSAPAAATGPAARPAGKIVTVILAAALLSFGWLGTSCTTPAGGAADVSISAQSADQVILTAEKAAKISHDTFKEFLQLDLKYREYVVQYAPAAHQFAEKLRAREPDASSPPNMIKWVQSLRSATMAFQNNRTPDNRANLETAYSVVNEALAQSNQYIAAINAKKGA